MHWWFCPIHLIHPIERKSIHFEKLECFHWLTSAWLWILVVLHLVGVNASIVMCAMRKAIKAHKNWLTIQQNEHTRAWKKSLWPTFGQNCNIMNLKVCRISSNIKFKTRKETLSDPRQSTQLVATKHFNTTGFIWSCMLIGRRRLSVKAQYLYQSLLLVLLISAKSVLQETPTHTNVVRILFVNNAKKQ